MLKFFKKVMGDKATRDMKALKPIVQKIHNAYETIKDLSNDELRDKTVEFKQRIADYISEEETEITRLKERIENDFEMEPDEKEKMYNQMDKLQKQY